MGVRPLPTAPVKDDLFTHFPTIYKNSILFFLIKSTIRRSSRLFVLIKTGYSFTNPCPSSLLQRYGENMPYRYLLHGERFYLSPVTTFKISSSKLYSLTRLLLNQIHRTQRTVPIGPGFDSLILCTVILGPPLFSVTISPFLMVFFFSITLSVKYLSLAVNTDLAA